MSDAPEVMTCETRDTWPGTGLWSRICCCCQRIRPRETDSSPPSLIRNTIEQCCDDKVQDPGASNTCQELKPTKKNDYFHLIISFMKHVDMKTVQIYFYLLSTSEMFLFLKDILFIPSYDEVFSVS